MAKYKICPSCGRRNPPNALDCEAEECGADLSTVHVTDEAFAGTASTAGTAGTAGTASGQTSSPFVRMVRICEECGAVNPANARKCRCGEEISDILPVPENSAAQVQTAPVKPIQMTPKNFMLSSLDGSLLYQISEGETILGREAELENYLEERLYVSRRHARLYLENGRLTIENLSATNYTFVNNMSLDGQRMELHEGDEIGLGGNSVNGNRQEMAAYFRVVRK